MIAAVSAGPNRPSIANERIALTMYKNVKVRRAQFRRRAVAYRREP